VASAETFLAGHASWPSRHLAYRHCLPYCCPHGAQALAPCATAAAQRSRLSWPLAGRCWRLGYWCVVNARACRQLRGCTLLLTATVLWACGAAWQAATDSVVCERSSRDPLCVLLHAAGGVGRMVAVLVHAPGMWHGAACSLKLCTAEQQSLCGFQALASGSAEQYHWQYQCRRGQHPGVVAHTHVSHITTVAWLWHVCRRALRRLMVAG
jgi:hypothetical protein